MSAPPGPIPNRTPAAATAVVKFHASLNVSDLGRSIEFYSALFGCAPVKSYADYAKFEVDVPPLVLSLKPKRACAGGPLNHLGLRVVTVEHLRAIQTRLDAALPGQPLEGGPEPLAGGKKTPMATRTKGR